jgi:hypothetical protein
LPCVVLARRGRAWPAGLCCVPRRAVPCACRGACVQPSTACLRRARNSHVVAPAAVRASNAGQCCAQRGSHAGSVHQRDAACGCCRRRQLPQPRACGLCARGAQSRPPAGKQLCVRACHVAARVTWRRVSRGGACHVAARVLARSARRVRLSWDAAGAVLPRAAWCRRSPGAMSQGAAPAAQRACCAYGACVSCAALHACRVGAGNQRSPARIAHTFERGTWLFRCWRPRL